MAGRRQGGEPPSQSIFSRTEGGDPPPKAPLKGEEGPPPPQGIFYNRLYVGAQGSRPILIRPLRAL